jgi:predicted enzyme related to lactoylglutathione lyase
MANRQLNAKLVICNVPTHNSAAARQFYNTLLGGHDFARSLNSGIESYYRPISQDGLTLTIGTRQEPREPITCFFAVDNLEETVSQLVAAGGKVIVNSRAFSVSGPPEAMNVFEEAQQAQPSSQAQPSGQQAQPSSSAGSFATMLDPDGNYLGLMQMDSSTQQLFNAQPEQRVLSQAQVDQLDNWKQHGEPLMD